VNFLAGRCKFSWACDFKRWNCSQFIKSRTCSSIQDVEKCCKNEKFLGFNGLLLKIYLRFL